MVKDLERHKEVGVDRHQSKSAQSEYLQREEELRYRSPRNLSR